MYGRFCGPYWSDAQWQQSVIPSVDPIDELDAVCAEHDEAYATGGDLLAADLRFAQKAYGLGWRGALFAHAVGLQAKFRAFDSAMAKSQKLRGAPTPTPKPTQTSKSKPKMPKQTMQLVTPPVAFGSTMTKAKADIVRTKDTVRVRGNDFAAQVDVNSTSLWGMSKSALLSPAFLQSAALGNIARSYERYKWNFLRVHYVPKVSTTTNGAIILTSQRSVSEPGVSPSNANFLPRAMSQGNACFTPIWAPAYIDIDPSDQWYLVDPATTVDPDDSIAEELLVYGSGINGVAGYLIVEYDIVFKEPLYQPHTSQLPISTGPGVRGVMTLSQAVNAVGDAVILTEFSPVFNINLIPNGTILRAVFDVQGSSFPSPTNSTTFAETITKYSSNVSTIVGSASNLTFLGGNVTYWVVNGANVEVYLTLEGAVTGSGSAQLFYQTATTTIGSFQFDATIIRYSPITLNVSQ